MANALTITETQTEFTPQQQQALTELGIGGVGPVTPGELKMFLIACQQTGLNPFLKQIYLISRKDKHSPNGFRSTIQVGIDGLRTIADRVTAKKGEAYGISSPLWCGTDGVWHDFWIGRQYPAAAKVTVQRRHGTFTAVAMFREFAAVKDNRLSGLWGKMPAHMIAKVAEAHALRKAFPSEMSDVYTDDEMEQAGPAVQTPAQPAPRVPVLAAPVQPQPQQAAPQPVQPQPVQQPRQPRRQAPAAPVQAPARPAPAAPVQAQAATTAAAPKQAPQPAPATGGDPWAANMTTAPMKQPTAAEKKKDAEWLKGLEQARQELAEQSKKQADAAAKEPTK